MKKWLKITIITLCAVLVVAGGTFAAIRLTPKKSVNVSKAEYWMLNWMPNQSYLYGIVSSEASQSIYKDESKKIIEVLVAPGDSVEIGQPLMRYDSTLDELDLQQKLLERDKLMMDIQLKYKDYQRYAREDYPATIPSPTPAPTKEPRVATATEGGVIRLGSFGGFKIGTVHARPLLALTPEGGAGTELDPMVYLVPNGQQITNATLLELSTLAQGGTESLYAVFVNELGVLKAQFLTNGGVVLTVDIEESNPVVTNLEAPSMGNGSALDPFIYSLAGRDAVDANFISLHRTMANETMQSVYARLVGSCFTLELCFNPDNSWAVTLTVTQQEPTEAPTEIPTGAPTDIPTETPTYTPTHTPSATDQPTMPPQPPNSGMTKAEREELARQLAKEIRELEIKYRQLSLDIRKLQLSGVDGTIFSTIKGVVTVVNDYASMPTGELILELQGGSGMNIVGMLSELELDKYPIGTELTGMCYTKDGMNEVKARVSSIGTMPVTDRYSNGGNQNSSGYLMTMDIVGDSKPQLGDYIEFTGYQPLASTGTIYLHEAYIGSYNGEDCIYISRNGVLEREIIRTGRRADYYRELLNTTLTMEDYIAFPYDKNCKPGAPTTTEEPMY